MLKTILCILVLLAPQAAFAQNREAGLDFERGKGDIRAIEKDDAIIPGRDLMGRKVYIDPDSKIDPGSLQIDAAPGSTVIVRAQQYDMGVQRVNTPLYKNVELPNE